MPNTAANSGAVANLCKAIEFDEHEVTIAYGGEKQFTSAIRDAYDLPESINIIHLPTIPGPFQKIVWVLISRYRLSGYSYITRMPDVSVLLAFLGEDAVLELHQHLDTFRRWKTWRKMLPYIDKKKLKVAALTQPIVDSLDPLMTQNASSICVIPSAGEDFLGIKSKVSFDAGYVGSLMPGKGIERVKELATRIPDCSFIIYGDVKKAPDIAGELEAMDNVTLGGFVPQSKIQTALASFRIGLAPYASSGFGGKGGPFVSMDSMSSLKVIEYMSASRTILASNIPSIKTMVIDREHAILCSPDDIENWETRLRELLDDPKLCVDLAQNARKRFEERYSFSKRAKAFLSLMNKGIGT